MPASPDQLQTDLSALNQARSARGFAPLEGATQAAEERDSVITPSDRVKRFGIFNVSWDTIKQKAKESVKESIWSVPVGVGVGMFAATTGLGAVAGGGVAALSGGLRGGIREHGRQTVEKWARIRQEKNKKYLLNPIDFARGFMPDEKRKLAVAIGQGALSGLVFGSVGGAVGGVLAESAVGQAFGEKLGEAGNVVKGWKESWQLPSFGNPAQVSGVTAEPTATVRPPTQTPSPTEAPVIPTPEPPPAPAGALIIEAGPDSPEIKLSDNAQGWMKGANDINGDYGVMKQAEVGKIVPKIDEFLAAQNITPANTDPIRYETLRDQLIGNAESKINKVFDSHLQEAVERGMSLDQVHQTWNKDFTSWVDTGMNGDLTTSLQSIQEGMVQIERVLTIPDSVGYARFAPEMGGFTNQYFTGFPDVEIGRNNAGFIGAELAANYDILNEGWRKIHPDMDFPVHIGEITYIVDMAIKNDPFAIERLKLAFSGLTKEQEIRVLSDLGVRNIWEVLSKIK